MLDLKEIAFMREILGKAWSKFRRRQVPPRPWRPDWLPKDMPLYSEALVHPHVQEERANLFLAYNTGTTEVEVLNWLHATACLIKPHNLLETGASAGLGTLALAAACKANGFGKVHSIEIDPSSCTRVTKLLQKHGLLEFAELHCSDSLAFLRQTTLTFDIGFFDSLCELRAEEFAICRERNILNGPAVFHDTSGMRTQSLQQEPSVEVHAAYREKLYQHAAHAAAGGYFEHHLSRGLFVIYPKNLNLHQVV